MNSQQRVILFIDDVWLFDSRGQFAWFASYIPKVSNFYVVVFDEIDSQSLKMY